MFIFTFIKFFFLIVRSNWKVIYKRHSDLCVLISWCNSDYLFAYCSIPKYLDELSSSIWLHTKTQKTNEWGRHCPIWTTHLLYSKHNINIIFKSNQIIMDNLASSTTVGLSQHILIGVIGVSSEPQLIPSQKLIK